MYSTRSQAFTVCQSMVRCSHHHSVSCLQAAHNIADQDAFVLSQHAGLGSSSSSAVVAQRGHDPHMTHPQAPLLTQGTFRRLPSAGLLGE